MWNCGFQYVEKHDESPVLFFKSQGLEDAMQAFKKDFAVIIMTTF